MKSKAQIIIEEYNSTNETAIDDEAIKYIIAVAMQSAWERDNDDNGDDSVYSEVAEIFSEYNMESDSEKELEKSLKTLNKLDLHALYSDLEDIYGDESDWPKRN
jgi:hypothetical protein